MIQALQESYQKQTAFYCSQVSLWNDFFFTMLMGGATLLKGKKCPHCGGTETGDLGCINCLTCLVRVEKNTKN
jgi:hypothetical protein